LVDTVPPTTVISLSGTLGASGWYTSNVTVSFTATDATSGVANVSYRIDGGPWLAYAGPFALDEGSHVVDYFSSDVAGLVETKHSQSIAIDTTPASTTASVSGTAGTNGWYITTVVVSLSSTDPVSGVSNVYSHVDSGPWQISIPQRRPSTAPLPRRPGQSRGPPGRTDGTFRTSSWASRRTTPGAASQPRTFKSTVEIGRSMQARSR